MRRLTRSPWLWLAAFAVWFGTLWWLSSRVNHLPQALDFRASDKVLHFGYFFGGAGLFSAFLYRLKPKAPDWGTIFAITFAVCFLTGATDEWHQTQVPGRSGNDAADLTADILGAMCGALVFRKLHRVLK
ncbi:VanZ family protein [Luteolibacter flavescens]|uniref:VanZ family protein n=1 Tax=Luteolibacter flavescens TaxID=1859460 RepID=A0ABT3FMB7_9BACT|nr:VanZ family protein [Luteolibacter flavescens]MCW1884727.1 VanZ family protein [Luteolibacter flavescens]